MPAIPKPLADHLSEVQRAIGLVDALNGVILAAADTRWESEYVILMAEAMDKILGGINRDLDPATLARVPA